MNNEKTHVALRIALLGLIMVFVIVCGAHLGGLRHDDSGGRTRSIRRSRLLSPLPWSCRPQPAGRVSRRSPGSHIDERWDDTSGIAPARAAHPGLRVRRKTARDGPPHPRRGTALCEA